MSNFGLSVFGEYSFLPIDEDYHNFVLDNKGRTYVSSGVRTFRVRSSGHATLQIAVRHPGITVALLGYLKDSHGVYGARVYVSGSGYIYWKAYIENYFLPEIGTGMVVYDEHGTQTFHSDHTYADVNYANDVVSTTHVIKYAYYFLFLPSLPSMTYEGITYSWQGPPIYSRQCTRVYVEKYFTRYVTDCSYTTDMFGNSSYTCETNTVVEDRSYWTTECVQVITGYYYYQGIDYYMDKRVVGMYQNGNELTPNTITINSSKHVYGTGTMDSTMGSFITPPGYFPVDVRASYSLANYRNSVIALI